jgi:periplasmic divalent cation tolerance protein
MATVCMVFMTAPDQDTAVRLTRTVVEEGLAACGNLIEGVRSIYSWKGEVHDDAEVLVLFKTTLERVDSLRFRLIELHPYDCPEVLVVETDGGHADYLEWVAETVRKKIPKG